MCSKVKWSRYIEDEEKKLADQMNHLGIDSNNVEGPESAIANATQTNESTSENLGAGDAGGVAGTKCNRVAILMDDDNSRFEIQKQDPNSPLYFVKTFEELHLKPNLLKGVYEMGFQSPSKIQEAVLPTLLADPPQNLIVQSQPGTGKTTAFVLAMLSRVDTDKHYPQVLCLSPTYELAIQTGEVAAHMAKFCPEIEFKYALRGEEIPRGKKLTEHILIGTPGKVLDWAIKYRSFDLSKITVFVPDEFDVLTASQGHQEQYMRIYKCLSSSCQMMFFSFTDDSEIMSFAEIIIQNPIIIKLKESLEN